MRSYGFGVLGECVDEVGAEVGAEWLKKKMGPIANLELVQELYEWYTTQPVSWCGCGGTWGRR